MLSSVLKEVDRMRFSKFQWAAYLCLGALSGF
jgi:hypothetical protein